MSSNDIIEKLKASMLPVRGSTFMMGDLLKMYKPLLSYGINCVKVSLQDFYICDHTITESEWNAVMQPDQDIPDSQYPVVGKTWHDVQCFIDKLNKITGWNFRLPTEAEWEYSARDGELTKGFVFAGRNVLDAVGWYNANSGRSIHPICQKESNQLGLFDMCGNVWEWCQDIYQPSYPLGARKGFFSSERYAVVNPQGGVTGKYRVIRGGSYRSKDSECWVFYREKLKSTSSANDLGFRLAY